MVHYNICKLQVEKKKQEEKMKRDQLNDQYIHLVDKQRLYFKTVKDFKEVLACSNFLQFSLFIIIVKCFDNNEDGDRCNITNEHNISRDAIVPVLKQGFRLLPTTPLDQKILQDYC